MSNEYGRIPPHAIDIEEAILGAILINSSAINAVVKYLTEKDFYKPIHEEVYKAILSLHMKQDAIDLLTVSLEAKSLGLNVDAVYLAELTNKIASTAHLESHCRIVKEKSMRRQLIVQATDIIKTSFDESEDIFEAINKADLVLTEARNIKSKVSKQTNAEIIDLVMKRMTGQREGMNITPIHDLNEILLPIEAGEVILIAGRPGMGKSIVATTVAKYTGIYLKKKVILWGLELTNEQNMRRMLSNVGEIVHSDIKLGRADVEKLGTAGDAIIKSRMQFVDLAGVTALEIRSRLISEKPDIAIIDYGDLIRNMGKKSTTDEISDTIVMIKQTAKDLMIPIVLFWQMNRAVEDRGGHIPLLRDLRNSGSLEQVASKIVFIYRPEYYNIDTYEHKGQDYNTKGLAVAIVAKNTEGECANCLMRFEPNYMRFSPWIQQIFTEDRMVYSQPRGEVPF